MFRTAARYLLSFFCFCSYPYFFLFRSFVFLLLRSFSEIALSIENTGVTDDFETNEMENRGKDEEKDEWTDGQRDGKRMGGQMVGKGR